MHWREEATTTPARRQYLSLKQQYPGVILFFRMGDFYETFDEDAETVAEVLDIALTSREMGRGNRVPMAGIPYHSADSYLGRLLSAGLKVAIAEQVSEPTGKGIVDRRVTGIVTPGTVTNPELLDTDENTFIAAYLTEGDRAGLALADVTTGEFATTTLVAREGNSIESILTQEIERISPRELVTRELETVHPESIDAVQSSIDELDWRLDEASELLLSHFKAPSLEPFGCEEQPLATRAAGALLSYLQQTQLNELRQITTLYTYSTERFMQLDRQTRRNLEIEVSTSRTGGASLVETVDATLTPPGGRLLRRWLGQPLLISNEIEARYDGVAWFATNAMLRTTARDSLRGMADLERILNRIVNRQAGPREVARLGDAVARLPDLEATLDTGGRPDIVQAIPDVREGAAEIDRAISDEPPHQLGNGQAIRSGYSPELDELRETLRRDREYIAGLEARERERTGIERMKVGYNKVFGYYLEISNANRVPVPDHYIRKQTLVNAERYITPELKEAEQRVATAEERIAAAEEDAYTRLLSEIAAHSEPIRSAARIVATIDVIAGLGDIAATRGYVRPEIVEEDTLDIRGGRHPIVEHEMSTGEFVPNDTRLGGCDGRIAIITGPNMAGKSTYLRQVALIVLLAQVGCFVPAESMRFSVVDRIFTRIGAQDDLASGQSTFMIEMLETATILNHANPNSLVVLDEIGRGTSTYDGLAIATAIVEYLHNTPRLRPRTLFATHYHELTALADTLPNVRNYRVDVLESGERIAFLYRVVPGGADRSYGVYVARLAGMPEGVVRRADDILHELEEQATGPGRQRRVDAMTRQTTQLTLFGGNHPAIERLQEIDVDALSPLEAITRLYEFKSLLEDADDSG